MSDNLEFLLRRAVKSGLNYLSLSPNHSNPKAAKWCSAYRHVENSNCQYVDDDDPIEAVRKAIEKGEREVKQARKDRGLREELAFVTEEVQAKNKKKVAEVKAVKEKAQAARRRDMEDLV